MEDAPDLSTGIEGLSADGVYQGTPVFDVSNKEFFENLRKDRQHFDFTSDKPKQYMKGTDYRQNFYVRYTDPTGKEYLNKLK